MFVRRLSVEWVNESGTESGAAGAGKAQPCPLRWIDNFAMRNFTNEAVFDDTLPLGDGLMEVGHRVPLDALRRAMEDWFRRKGYIGPADSLLIGPDKSLIMPTTGRDSEV